MKKLAAAIVASILLGGVAHAADLPSRSYTKAPVVSPVYNWSGFYVGINGGGGSARNCWDLTAGGVIPGVTPEGCHNATGGTVGGQIGYRWQATNWVFGLEAQGNWANFRGSNPNLVGVPVAQFEDATKIDSFGLFTGQVGYAFNNVLLYAKGGAAVVHDKYSLPLTPAGAAILAFAFPTFAGQAIQTGSETRWGGAVGAGVEFGFAPNWSVAVEYDHLFMGRRSNTLNSLPPFLIFPATTHSISQDIDVGMVRVNYRFGGPVVARY